MQTFFKAIFATLTLFFFGCEKEHIVVDVTCYEGATTTEVILPTSLDGRMATVEWSINDASAQTASTRVVVVENARTAGSFYATLNGRWNAAQTGFFRQTPGQPFFTLVFELRNGQPVARFFRAWTSGGDCYGCFGSGNWHDGVISYNEGSDLIIEMNNLRLNNSRAMCVRVVIQ